MITGVVAGITVGKNIHAEEIVETDPVWNAPAGFKRGVVAEYFKPNPAQQQIESNIKKYTHNIMIKARQIGASTDIAHLVSMLMFDHPNTIFSIIVQDWYCAKRMHCKILEHVRQIGGQEAIDTEDIKLITLFNGSAVCIGTSRSINKTIEDAEMVVTKRVKRENALIEEIVQVHKTHGIPEEYTRKKFAAEPDNKRLFYLSIMDEAAFIPKGDKVFEQLEQVSDRMCLISTLNGSHDQASWKYNWYTPKSIFDYHVSKLPWQLVYDEKWYKNQCWALNNVPRYIDTELDINTRYL
jgi:hypothetical protein